MNAAAIIALLYVWAGFYVLSRTTVTGELAGRIWRGLAILLLWPAVLMRKYDIIDKRDNDYNLSIGDTRFTFAREKHNFGTVKIWQISLIVMKGRVYKK